MKAYIDAVGLYAPGLQGWCASREVLAGNAPYQAEPLAKYKPALLPANERRRATNSVRIAFGACEDAISERLEDAKGLGAVFASSGGDYGVHDLICKALLREEIAVSPTHFHNSVHNAAAGYWSIASASRQPSVSLSAHDESVAAGLLEALPLVAMEQQPVLLVFSDCEVVAAMHSQRPIENPFAAALWLTPEQTEQSIAALSLALSSEAPNPTACANAELETLRGDNPAARSLVLLELLAKGESGTCELSAPSQQRLSVRLETL